MKMNSDGLGLMFILILLYIQVNTYQKTVQSYLPFYFFLFPLLLLFEFWIVSARCRIFLCSVVNSFSIFGIMSGFYIIMAVFFLAKGGGL